MNRVVALIDMDCFYVQVEQRAEPIWQGLPCAVVQYKPYRGGSIIAVNYEARAAGVGRFIWGDDAVAACPSIHLFRVPELRGKADLTRYRKAGAEVLEVFTRRIKSVERASIDEAYLDLTEEVDQRCHAGYFPTPVELVNTVVEGEIASEVADSIETEKPKGLPVDDWLSMLSADGNDEDTESKRSDRRLAVGAAIIEEIRAEVYRDTGFRCSAGIAHNKILAKLTCGLHKPNKQTVLPQSAVNYLFKSIPLHKVRGFGGKFGKLLTQQLGVEKMIDLQKFSEAELALQCDDKSARWVYEICRGIDNDSVSSRLLAKSIGCGKNFLGREKLDTPEKVQYWLKQFSDELIERLTVDRELNGRVAKTLTVTVSVPAYPHYQSSSRSTAMSRYDAQAIADDAFTLILKFNTSNNKSTWVPPLQNITLSAGRFCELKESNTKTMKSFFASSSSKSSADSTSSATSSSSISSSVVTDSAAGETSGRVNGVFTCTDQSRYNCGVPDTKITNNRRVCDLDFDDDGDSDDEFCNDELIKTSCRYVNDTTRDVFGSSSFSAGTADWSASISLCENGSRSDTCITNITSDTCITNITSGAEDLLDSKLQQTNSSNSRTKDDRVFIDSRINVKPSAATSGDSCRPATGTSPCESKKLYRYTTASQSQNMLISKMFSKAKYQLSATDSASWSDSHVVSDESHSHVVSDESHSTDDAISAPRTDSDTAFNQSAANLVSNDSSNPNNTKNVLEGHASEFNCNSNVASTSSTIKSSCDQIEQLSAAVQDDEDMMMCFDCGQRVSVWLMPEHTDYHYAMDLEKQQQAEDRMLRAPSNSVSSNLKRKSPASGKPNAKRKGTDSKANDNAVKLDTFFQRL